MLFNSLPKVLRRFRFSSLGLRARLLFFVLIFIVPILTVFYFNRIQRVEQEIERVQLHALNLAQVAASTQNQHVESARQLLVALAQSPEVRNLDSAGCNAYFSQLLPSYPNYTIIGAVDLTGQGFCSALPEQSDPGLNFSDRPWFQRVVETDDFAVGDFHVGMVTGQTGIAYAYPIHNDADELIGVVMVSESLQWLSFWLGEIQLPLDTHIMLIDQQGTMLAHDPPAPESIGLPITDAEFMEALASVPEGTIEAHGHHTETWLYGYSSIAYGPANVYLVVGMPKAQALADISALLRRNLIFLIGMIIAVSTVILIGGTVVIIRPIQKLNLTVEELTKGDLNTRTNLHNSVNEFKRLAISIDRLTTRLFENDKEAQMATRRWREQMQQYETIKRELAQVVEEKDREIEERERAQQADQLKLRFLGMVAHELQTPLTSIKGFATTLLADDVTWDEANQRQFLQIIDEETNNVMELVRQLLDLSQIESGMMRIQPIATCMRTIAERAEPHLRALATKHELSLELMAQNSSIVHADPKRITQVLVNLVSNAAKYAPEGTKITVDAHDAHNYLQVNVHDEGPGIPEGELQRVFKPFIRTENWLEKREGVGLGLAICKGLIDAHGGKIWAENHADGPGATISFTLPKHTTHPLAQAEPADEACSPHEAT